jgi:hypothetical protein
VATLVGSDRVAPGQEDHPGVANGIARHRWR